jgi:hypothetical protein
MRESADRKGAGAARFRARAVLACALVALVACGCSSGNGGLKAGPTSVATGAPAAAAPTSTSTIDYADAASWLCRPGKTPSPCQTNLDATVKAADGSFTPDPFIAATDPKIDCFSVYPTVSNDPGQNSDMVANAAENNVVVAQAARFASVCRLFAPIYRQVTLTALNKGIGNFLDPQAHDRAYNDVLAAFQQYLAKDNQGRGFVLIGHSQGSMHLIRLIKEQIDPNPQVRSRLISALILGAGVRVPAGADVGGDFTNVPACRKPDQTGCVVAYSSFNALSPPPSNSLFGRGGVLCVNPAALAGGPADLRGYYPAGNNPGAAGVTTPYVATKGSIQGECVNQDGASYLQITAAPTIGIPANISGPQWGLHVIDVNLTQGDLIALVAKQAAAFGGR